MTHAVHTPGAYSDMSHVIAVFTITMALMAVIRLRPAVRDRRRRKRGRHG